MADAQKAARAWMDLGSEVAADARKASEVSFKEITKLFAPVA